MQNVEINWELLGKKLAGELSENENTEFQSWLEESGKNKQLFQAIQKLWEKTIAEKKYQELDVEADLELVKQKLNLRKYQPYMALVDEKNSKSSLFVQTLKIAASIIVLLGIGIAALYYQNGMTDSQIGAHVISTPNGSKSNIILADGTEVWMNAGSKLTYASDFNKNRKVYLEGEAYFDVVKKHKQTFVVETSDLNVVVLGTAFNVKSYPNDKTIETTLVRGSVSVERKNKSGEMKNVLLEPSQKLTYLKKEVKLFVDDAMKNDGTDQGEGKLILSKKVDPELFTAWKDEKLIFKNEEMKKLKTTLERWYGIEIFIEDKELENLHYTGTIEKETINQVLEIMKMTMPIHYEIRHKKVTISIESDLDPKK